jgi:hypothetical protein
MYLYESHISFNHCNALFKLLFKRSNALDWEYKFRHPSVCNCHYLYFLLLANTLAKKTKRFSTNNIKFAKGMKLTSVSSGAGLNNLLIFRLALIPLSISLKIFYVVVFRGLFYKNSACTSCPLTSIPSVSFHPSQLETKIHSHHTEICIRKYAVWVVTSIMQLE